ncbi:MULTISPECIES: type II toxin-antitoxin system death-on-curing family toxin [Prevotellaceae]|uniref:Death-on-curing protein n=2 Tax=Prevotellaceae TaxID=171552 RepID=A0A096BMQ8_9BACT|nr:MULTISPECIES: Fic family protein [Prevotellaceae]KGF43992.1 death-on-curing protein [Prevotella melaninogenica DNF00666]PMC07358.1 type II toxin-antitoxin system death-on-curing family toxin [Hoylesella timonensis]
MEKISYITYDELLSIYYKMIEKSGGGNPGILKEGNIKAALEFVQNDEYYPTFAEKLTYLVYSFCCGHCFTDGNKRIALTIGATFLLHNGYLWTAKIFMEQIEPFVLHVAATVIDKELLMRIMICVVDSTDYDEELKIDIANAISKNVG